MNAKDAPIYVTKNGYGERVIMSMKRYEETLAKLDAYAKPETEEKQIARGGPLMPGHP